MDEKAEIEAKIRAYERKIDQHKQQRVPAPGQPYASRPPHPLYHQPRGNGRFATRGRGARGGYHHPRPRHVWVAGGPPTPPFESVALPDADAPGTPPASMTSRNGYILAPPSVGKMELMSKETFEREQKQREEYKLAQAQGKTTPPTPKPAAPVKSDRSITIESITFQISIDGSKLVRVQDLDNVFQETPKKANVAGVDFHRTKRGNLLRAPAQDNTTRFNATQPKKQCKLFTRQGNCPFGTKCHFAHDPETVAICKGFLKNGTCPQGNRCDLSHEMSYHRVSACTHFLHGNCTNEACRFPHVNISSSASVCRSFATLGYCASGEQCSRRHVFECPDHANHGKCTNPKCSMPHVDRASVMRKAAQRQAKIIIDSKDESDLSSDDGDSDGGDDDNESELDEVDSDDVAVGDIDDSYALTQQQDFVAFS